MKISGFWGTGGGGARAPATSRLVPVAELYRLLQNLNFAKNVILSSFAGEGAGATFSYNAKNLFMLNTLTLRGAQGEKNKGVLQYLLTKHQRFRFEYQQKA